MMINVWGVTFYFYFELFNGIAFLITLISQLAHQLLLWAADQIAILFER